MFNKVLISIALLLLVTGIATAAPTEYAMASAPQNQGNAITDTNNIVSYWQQAGWPSAALKTSAATKANILNYWQNDMNLLYYNNIGHADTPNYNGAPAYGLSFYDAEITATDISNLNPDHGIIGSKVFINSCNSFENPLHDAFLNHYLQMYIGGVVLLPMYSSEDTAADFWYNHKVLGQTANTALTNAENAHGTQNMFGLYGG